MRLETKHLPTTTLPLLFVSCKVNITCIVLGVLERKYVCNKFVAHLQLKSLQIKKINAAIKMSLCKWHAMTEKIIKLPFKRKTSLRSIIKFHSSGKI